MYRTNSKTNEYLYSPPRRSAGVGFLNKSFIFFEFEHICRQTLDIVGLIKIKNLHWLSLFLLMHGFSIEGSAQIGSDDYHIHRSDFVNSFTQFNNGEGRVAFLGGSITYNPGWRDSISHFLQRSFPKTAFDFIAAGIPSMGSTPGAFRLERDVLSKGRIDLLFVEAAVNDPTNGRTATEQIRAMEGIIRHAKEAYPKIDIVTMYFVDPDKMESYNNGKIPEVIVNHDQVAEHYGVSSINLAKEVTDRINEGEFTWEDDFKDLHPSPFGQMVYYQSIRSFLQHLLQPFNSSNPIKSNSAFPTKIDPYCYDRGKLLSIDLTKKRKGWQIVDDWTPPAGEQTRKGYVHVPMLCASEAGSKMKIKFHGRAIGIAVAAGPDAGMIDYKIDGAEWETIDLYTKWSSYLHLPWYYVLEAELESANHTLIIRINENNNAESNGTACRIKHFFINE